MVGQAPRAVARAGVCDLSMNAGTGKLKTVSAARAGVPRAQFDAKSLANYDANAALGIKKEVCCHSLLTARTHGMRTGGPYDSRSIYTEMEHLMQSTSRLEKKR